jgi:2-hydroxy-3-oxopropionate reductase
MLPDSPDVEEVVLGEQGVLVHARPGLLLIDMSTIRPQSAMVIAEAAPASGCVHSTRRSLVARPTRSTRRSQRWSAEQRRTLPWRCPSWGRWARSWLTSAVAAGQLVKAADQLLVGGIIELLSEALLLLEARDVDIQATVAGLGGGLAGSRVLELKAAGMLGRQFTPGFRIDLHHKDLGIVLAAAREVGIALPVTGLVSQLFTAARAQGWVPSTTPGS